MRRFSATVLISLSNGRSTSSSTKHFHCSFSSGLLPCQLDLFLSLLGLESFDSFHVVSKFLVVSYSLTASCECWLPCLKLSLHY